ncbi:crAss001_48 related protein [Peptostreptococcus anaerobius]|uniref:crAss001_48 related protein n=1 Tax=Peptostreptococcus anaerobius TaxID=1261 RepID=UPI003D2E661A
MNYIDRMKEELADLSNKLEKAEKALSILELNQIEHDYLLIQTSYMANYQAILKERIKYAEKKAGKL